MEIVRGVDSTFWWEVARRCAYATIYHTPFWMDLTLASFPGYRDATIGVVLPSGVRAVLPLLSIRRRGPLENLRSSLYYGGLIADGPLSEAEISQIYTAVCHWRTANLQVAGNPFCCGSALPSGFSDETDFIQAVDLQPDFAAVFNGFSKSCRTNYRSGVQKGVRVRRAASLADCRAFFAAYEDGLKRWERNDVPLQGSAFTWQQYKQYYQLTLQYPALAQLWVAEVDRQVVAGTWMFYWNQRAVTWEGIVHSDYLKYRVFNVLDVEVMRDAAERGCRTYDFGISGNMPGVLTYKDSYNPQRLPFVQSSYTSPLFAFARRMRVASRPLVERIRAKKHTS